jgi:FMN phosphatase YigB (HAD superfamily)/DNA-binding XRE family transcriptional regulator
MNEVGAEKALGQAIQAARKLAGLTQQELCQKTDISYSTLAKIERGAIKSPSVFTVARIATVTGVSVESLTGLDKQEHLASMVQKEYKTAKNGVQFVFFDINGCLVRFFQAAFTKLSIDSGVSAEVIESLFWHYNDAVCRGEMSLDDFNRTLAERLGIMVSWADYYLSSVEPVLEAHECLEWASENFKVGLMSNIMPGLIDSMIERKLLPQVEYATIIDSSAVHFIKPEIEIYQKAVEISGVPAEAMLLIDDSRANLMSAQKLGWHVLWFDDARPNESVERIHAALEL